MKQHFLQTPEELQIIVKELWQLPEREFQYFAVELLVFHKQLWNVSILQLFEYCLTHKSWWDTVDFIAIDCGGPYFKLHPAKISITNKWNKSGHLWLERSSLLFQNKYRQQTDLNLLAAYILHLSDSKEFFIRKAIGWCLREYAKTNPSWVVQFVKEHSLSPLSRKEALKNIK